MNFVKFISTPFLYITSSGYKEFSLPQNSVSFFFQLTAVKWCLLIQIVTTRTILSPNMKRYAMLCNRSANDLNAKILTIIGLKRTKTRHHIPSGAMKCLNFSYCFMIFYVVYFIAINDNS